MSLHVGDVRSMHASSEPSHSTCLSPGMVIVCVTPCRSLITGETAVIGEELILPLSGLGERPPLTRTSHPELSPPSTSLAQLLPLNLKPYIYIYVHGRKEVYKAYTIRIMHTIIHPSCTVIKQDIYTYILRQYTLLQFN